MLEKNHRFRIDDDSELFNKWFDFSFNSIKKRKTIDDKLTEKKIKNNYNYLTPTKSTAMKRLPTHSYNHFFQNQKQNLLYKFKDSESSKNMVNIKVNYNYNYGLSTQQKVSRKNSFLLPLLNKKNNSNAIINNEVNGFRRKHRKSVDLRNSNSIIVSQMNTNKNINENNHIIIDQKQNNNDDSNFNLGNINKEPTNIYKSKVSSCKQVRIRNYSNF